MCFHDKKRSLNVVSAGNLLSHNIFAGILAMTLLIRTISLVLSLLTVTIPVQAETLVIGVSAGYPPYYYKSDGILTGFCIDTVNAVAREIGIDVEYKVYPWKRLMLRAKNGDIDAIMPLFKTEERETYLIFKGLELAHELNHFFTTPDSLVTFDGRLESLESYRIGVVADYSYGEKFDSFNFPNKKITRDDKHLIKMFMHNRFDVGIGSRSVVKYHADLCDINLSIQFFEPPITKEILYLGFVKKRNRDQLADRFAQALQKFQATATHQRLIDKYGIAGPK